MRDKSDTKSTQLQLVKKMRAGETLAFKKKFPVVRYLDPLQGNSIFRFVNTIKSMASIEII